MNADSLAFVLAYFRHRDKLRERLAATRPWMRLHAVSLRGTL